MNKNKAIVKFVVIGMLTVIGILACFVNFRIPLVAGGYYRYVGFMGAIEEKMGIDLKGGVLVVFDTEENKDTGAEGSLDTQIDATVKRLERALNDKGFVEATVIRQGNKIRIEVPGMSETNELFQAIGEPAEIDMRTSDGKVFLTGKDISGVEYYQDQQTLEHGVKLNFTPEGGALFNQEVQNAGVGGSISIYANDKLISSPTIQSLEAGKDNSTVITSKDYTKQEAENFKIQIESGLFEVTLKPAETSIIPPTMGEGALRGGIIALLIGLAFIFVFMWLIYGDMGLLSNLSLVIYSIILLFALSVVGSVQLTLPGIAGIILSIGMAVDANIIICERIKDQYRAGKRMAVAVESGFNKSIMTIVDANVTSIIAAGVLFWLGTGPIKGFAVVLFLGVVISMFTSLIVTRSLAKLYLYINPNNAKRLKLKSSGETTESGVSQVVTAKPVKRALNFK